MKVKSSERKRYEKLNPIKEKRQRNGAENEHL
jgi:hypothetical protein